MTNKIYENIGNITLAIIQVKFWHSFRGVIGRLYTFREEHTVMFFWSGSVSRKGSSPIVIDLELLCVCVFVYIL